MASAKRSKRAAIHDALRQLNPGCVDEPLRDRLKREFAPVSDATLRTALLESGLPLDPMVEGVRQDELPHLERTLLALSGVYEHSEPARRKAVRSIVITAKTHARYALLRAREESRRKQKEEAVLWLRTWLENPPLFGTWLAVRKTRATEGRSTPPE